MRNQWFVFTFLLLVLSARNSHAQSPDSLKNRYITENITRLGSGFIKNGQRLSFPELRNEFAQSPVGQDLYLSARRNKTSATLFSIGSMASSIAILSFAASARGYNRTGMYISLGTQVIFALFSSQSRRRYIEYTDRALIERNRQVLFR